MRTDLILAAVAVLVVSGAGVRFTVFSGLQARRMRWRIRVRLRPGPGFATLPELVFRWGRWPAVFSHGRRARPGLRWWERAVSPTTAFAVRLGRGPYGRRCYARAERARLMFAGPRTGKTGLLADQVIDHPGPALITETRPDIWEASGGYRARLGPVHLFNPEGVGGYPSTFRWAMTAGCEDPAEAMRRAADLVGAAVSDAGDMQWWVEKSGVALAAGMHAGGLVAEQRLSDEVWRGSVAGAAAALHAGSLAGADMRDVWAWAQAPAANSALVTAAMRHPAASAELFGSLTELDRPGKTADSVRLTMTKSLGWLAIPALRDMVTGPGAVPFDVPGFVESRGTVYMLAPGGDDAPGAPLFRCFASYVHRQARLYSQLLPGRRLDPRLLFALDELHMCPVDLPSWLADTAGFGIDVAAVVHSMGQLEDKYGRAGAATVWATTGTKIFLPGIHDPRTLKDISELCGRLPGDGGDGRQDWVAPVELIERLPDWRALVIRSNLFPVVVKFRPFWRRLAFRLHGRLPLPSLPAVPAAEPASAVDEELAAMTAPGVAGDA